MVKGPKAKEMDVPEGLQEFLQTFVVAILRSKPDDLMEFAAEYFANELQERNEQESQKHGGGTLPGLTGAFRPGQTNDDDMDEDEDRMDEHEEEMLAKRNNYGRRKSVSAEGYDPEADEDDEEDDRIVHGKTDEQRQRLINVVEKMLLFKSLDSDQMSQILDAMFEKVVEPGENIIVEGDDGDYFYIIERGHYDCLKLIDGEQKRVFQYDNQGSFGELALMYNAPRAATIISTTEGSLWAMDRQTFRKIVVKATAKKRRMYEQFLKNVEVLSVLKEDEITKVADAIESRDFADGDTIINQGDAADYFYIVVEGEVSAKRRGDDKSDPSKEIHLANISQGNFFGELAFLTNKPRAASIYANGSVKCACLDVQAFERLLGPCKKLLERNMALYEAQLAQIAEGLSVEN
jgi:cAMP-dependent protein kinase regulator